MDIKRNQREKEMEAYEILSSSENVDGTRFETPAVQFDGVM
jgi:hypothetical protein